MINTKILSISCRKCANSGPTVDHGVENSVSHDSCHDESNALQRLDVGVKGYSVETYTQDNCHALSPALQSNGPTVAVQLICALSCHDGYSCLLS